MAEEYVLTEKSTLVNMADALREASGTTQEFTIDELQNGVVNAVSGGVEKPWTLINTITLAEAVNMIEITTDAYGNPFEYDEIAFYMDIKRADDTKQNMLIYLNSDAYYCSGGLWKEYLLSSHYTESDSSCYFGTFKWSDVWGGHRILSQITSTTYNNMNYPLYFGRSIVYDTKSKFNLFVVRRMNTDAWFGANSEITIWGR